MRPVRTVGTRLERAIAPVLIDTVPRDHQQSDAAFRRRRIVAAITLVVGTTMLGLSLAVRPGDGLFYPLTLAVAAVWIAGGLLSGPLHLGYEPAHGTPRRPVLAPFVLGLGAAAVFVAGALVVREIAPLRAFVVHVLEHASKGNLAMVAVVTAVNGIGEEIFFRGAVFAAVGRRRPVLVSTVIYALATVATGNPMLVFTAVTLGLVWALQRRATGGILASTITHVTWSLAMLFALPPLLNA